MIDWDVILQKLRSFPPNTHQLRAACAPERVTDEETRLGQMPIDLAQMLAKFNGGELFIDAIPFITVFGLSQSTDTLSSDWFIDRLTPKWRSGPGKANDWAFAMTNYGGMVILGTDSRVGEWDTSQRKWMADFYPVSEWIEKVIEEGAAYLNEE